MRRRKCLIFFSRRFPAGLPAIRTMALKKKGPIMRPVMPRLSQASSRMLRATLDSFFDEARGLRMTTIACSTARQLPDAMCVNTLQRYPSARSNATNAKLRSSMAPVDFTNGLDISDLKDIYRIYVMTREQRLQEGFQEVLPLTRRRRNSGKKVADLITRQTCRRHLVVRPKRAPCAII